MSAEPSRDRQRRLIQMAFGRSKLAVEDLWVRYFSVGGTAGPAELEAFLTGESDLEHEQRDLVASVVNERLDELNWRRRAPYSRDVREASPHVGPLAALIELLRGGYMAPPDLLPHALDRAAEALSVRVVLYLVDYDQTSLVPFPGAHGGRRSPLNIEGTLPGRAFRSLQTQVSVNEGEGRLWIPVVDGVERMGVLDVMAANPEDVQDPMLREQCWWLAHLAGHLVASAGELGDAVDTVRRSRPRSLAAELIWQLLPPLTAATDKVVVSGRIEPANDVGGDVFDYSVTDRDLHLAIIDATGHDLSAGLVSATALAAYRNARREGRSLFDQAQTVDEAVTAQFGRETFATGVMARLDLVTGRFRYVNAGHPPPLLLRDGRVVKSLEHGRRPLFGLAPTQVDVGEEQLERGDSVVMYTDGITEARDEDGEVFGLAGLIDFLVREMGSEAPLPEVVRSLGHAILRRQGGALQDDATLLVAQWTLDEALSLAPPPQ